MSKEAFDKIATGLMEALTLAKSGLIEEAITAQFGDRCPDYEPGCYCCEAWRELDRLRDGFTTQEYSEFTRLMGDERKGE